MLSHANFQYEDCRMPFEEFGQKKAQGYFPLGSMPIWEEDGFKMCQSSAILRMMAIRTGYYSDDPMTCWAIDSLVDFAEDMRESTATYTIHCSPNSLLMRAEPINGSRPSGTRLFQFMRSVWLATAESFWLALTAQPWLTSRPSPKSSWTSTQTRAPFFLNLSRRDSSSAGRLALNSTDGCSSCS